MAEDSPSTCRDQKGVDRRDVHRSFFDYAPIGKQKLFSEHPVCQRLSGLVATWIPARRALSIDPIILLREE